MTRDTIGLTGSEKMQILSKLVLLIPLGFFALANVSPASAVIASHLAKPRCTWCVFVQKAEDFDCRAVAELRRFGGCSGFCRGFAEGSGVSKAVIDKCISDCNIQVAQCNGEDESQDEGRPNCKWYSKGDIRKYICRIY